MLHKTLFFLIFLFTQALAFSQCNDDVKSGEGTFYGGIAGSSGGNCSLPVAANDFMHCALNNTDYQNSNACGACLEVTGSLGKTIVKVVDRCPECKPGDVDLTQQAFSKIANPIDGRVPITWKFVPCPLTGGQTIKVNFKSGSSKYWTAIQFRDLKHAVTKMEYYKNNTWIDVNRVLFNFFIEPQGINTPMKLRITSILGEQLILDNIQIDTNTDFDTGLQFKTPQECQGDEGSTTPPDNSFKPHEIPGRIEAEDFDKGGQSIGYNDSDPTNNGRQYRNEGVDIQSTGDLGGTFNVGWTQQGEWLNYTVEVKNDDTYDFVFRTASIFDTSSFQVFIDDRPLIDQVIVPNTNNWQKYTDVIIPNIELTQGKHVFRISVRQSGFNLNYWSALVSGSRNSKNLLPKTIIAYPNPTFGILHIQDQGDAWKIMDLQGNIIERGTKSQVDLSSYKNGNYFLVTDRASIQIIKQ